jgi:hypothetical protein
VGGSKPKKAAQHVQPTVHALVAASNLPDGSATNTTANTALKAGDATPTKPKKKQKVKKCSYISENGRCEEKSAGGMHQLCVWHTCTQEGCSNQKGSLDDFCGMHVGVHADAPAPAPALAQGDQLPEWGGNSVVGGGVGIGGVDGGDVEVNQADDPDSGYNAVEAASTSTPSPPPAGNTHAVLHSTSNTTEVVVEPGLDRVGSSFKRQQKPASPPPAGNTHAVLHSTSNTTEVVVEPGLDRVGSSFKRQQKPGALQPEEVTTGFDGISVHSHFTDGNDDDDDEAKTLLAAMAGTVYIFSQNICTRGMLLNHTIAGIKANISDVCDPTMNSATTLMTSHDFWA